MSYLIPKGTNVIKTVTVGAGLTGVLTISDVEHAKHKTWRLANIGADAHIIPTTAASVEVADAGQWKLYSGESHNQLQFRETERRLSIFNVGAVDTVVELIPNP